MKELSKIKSIDEWPVRHAHPLIVAGPCGAESPEQMMAIATELKKNKMISIFRAGIWKPRTRPNAFEGVGTIGLKWLQEVKRETGLLTTVEVANAFHAEEAMKYGVDVLWIGARTTVNPFTVQEIADAIRGTGIPVMIKNPVNPELNLWIGGIERIYQAGTDHIIAVHRGFSSFRKSKFRNEPDWEIPIELKRNIPNLPIICDPSHIAGRTDLLLNVSQLAFDLEMDGLMIETHCNPEKALSDINQQITPTALIQLLEDIVIRDHSAIDVKANRLLDELRMQVDAVDEELVKLFALRKKLVEKIGLHKKKNGLTILQLSRWDYIMRERIKQGEFLNLDKEFILALYQLIHDDSIRLQTEILNDDETLAAIEALKSHVYNRK